MSGAAIGIIGAVGAFGGVLINMAFRQSFLVAKTGDPAFWAFIAFYLGRVHKAQGAELPEDRIDANNDDGDAELGFFSPWSWWPIILACGAALGFHGLAVGFWITFIAIPVVIIALVGWVYEYYRGNFAR